MKILVFSCSDIRDGAIACLLGNLMEQLTLDQSVDIFHQARRIAYACPVFQSEVNSKINHQRISLFHIFI